MTAIFVARKQMSVKSYDAKVTKIMRAKSFQRQNSLLTFQGLEWQPLATVRPEP